MRTLATGHKPTSADATIHLDIGINVVPNLEVEVQNEEWDHFVSAELVFSISDSRYLARRIAVGVSSRVTLQTDENGTLAGINTNSLHEVNSVLLRQVRVAEIVRVGASGGIFVSLDVDGPPASLQDWYGTKGEPRYSEGKFGEFLIRQGPTPAVLPLVALTYMIAIVSGQPPAKSVERNFGIPSRTAANWISKAKAADLIKTPRII